MATKSARPNEWTARQMALLSEMWLAGVGTTRMGGVLGRSRGAVAAKLSALGLLGRKGTGTMPGEEKPVVVVHARRMLEDITGSDVADDVEKHLIVVAAVAVAMGRGSISGGMVADPVIDGAMRALDGIWPADGEPPARWWSDDGASFLADVAAAAA